MTNRETSEEHARNIDAVRSSECHYEKNEKSFLNKIKDKITGKDEHESSKTALCNTCTTDERCDEHRVVSQEVDEHECAAKELRNDGMKVMKETQHKFTDAERVQQKAKLAAKRANAKTGEALIDQERGQSMLAESGAHMIDAGAKLQQQANSTQIGQVPFNEHRQGEIQQTTCVSAAGQEPSQHEQATVRNLQYSEAH